MLLAPGRMKRRDLQKFTRIGLYAQEPAAEMRRAPLHWRLFTPCFTAHVSTRTTPRRPLRGAAAAANALAMVGAYGGDCPMGETTDMMDGGAKETYPRRNRIRRCTNRCRCEMRWCY